MQAAGFDPAALAEPRPDASQGAVLIGWLSSYFASRAKVAEMLRPDPWPDEALPAIARADPPEPWPDGALPVAARADPPEPWPDESPAAPLKPEAKTANQFAAAAPTSGEVQNAQNAPSKAGAAKARDKNKAANKAKKNQRKLQQRSKRR